MTLDRRSFLRRTSLALAGGLIVGDAALELFERLTHRKVWALGAPAHWSESAAVPSFTIELLDGDRVIERHTGVMLVNGVIRLREPLVHHGAHWRWGDVRTFMEQESAIHVQSIMLTEAAP